MNRALLLLVLAAPTQAFAADEIVVTAERREQSTSTLAGNAAGLWAEELARIGAQTPNEALNRLPGVAIHRNNGLENLPAIRSPVLTGGQSAGSFLVLEDGIPIRAPGFGNVNDLFETNMDFAKRVEVVRGPGSALYGSNAVHGIVNVITPDPCMEICWQRLRVDGGSFERANAMAIVSAGIDQPPNAGPLEELVVGRPPPPHPAGLLGVSLRHDGGFRDDSGLDQQRGLFRFDGSLGDWDLSLGVSAQNLNQETASFIEGPNAYKNSTLARTNPTPGAYRDEQLVRTRVTLSRDIGETVRFVATPYFRWIDADLNLSFFPSQAQELSQQQGGGVQAGLYWDPSEALSFIVGTDVDHTRGALREYQFRATQPNGYVQGLHYDYAVDMDVAALYAQASWAFVEDWRVVAGLRGEHVSYDYDNHASDGVFGRFRRAPDRTDEFDAVTPKLGIVWNPAEEQTLWLNLARGARPPQITDLYSLQATQTPGGQEVEKLDSAELGWRGDVGPASLEVELYHMDKRDTSFRNADGFTVTGAATRHQGIEVSGSLPLGESWDVSGWVTYARHTYRFDNPSSRLGESITSGDDVDGAPRWISNARLQWTPTGDLAAELEWVHMGEYFTNAANTRTYSGHDVLNLRASWDVTDEVSLFGAVRNLTNTDYAERADFAFGNDRYFPGEDRGFTIGVDITRY